MRDLAILAAVSLGLAALAAMRNEHRPRALLGLLALGMTSLGAILVLVR